MKKTAVRGFAGVGLCLLVLIAAGGVLAGQADREADQHINDSCAWPAADQVVFYVDVSREGPCVVLGIRDYANAGEIGLPNDSISALKVGTNVAATLCENDNYGGVCETFTMDNDYLGGSTIGNDRASSARVTWRPDVYEPDGSCEQAKRLGGSETAQTHNFHVAGDVDWVKFTSVLGYTYTVETANLGNNCDTDVWLFGANCTALLTNVDVDPGPASRVVWPATYAGTAYARVLHRLDTISGAGTDHDLRLTMVGESRVFLPVVTRGGSLMSVGTEAD